MTVRFGTKCPDMKEGQGLKPPARFQFMIVFNLIHFPCCKGMCLEFRLHSSG